MQFQDFRFGVRTLVKSPGFSLVAILTLALGICGTAATFSVVDHVLLRPLPYPGADRVVDVSESAQGRRTTVSPPNFMDWHNENVTFEALAGYQEDNLTLSAGDQPERVDAAAVGPEVFDVLAMRPLFGRVFTKDEARPGAAKVVAISHALWQRRFGSNPDLVGHTITLEGEAYTVVGIMPERFDFPDGIQLWVPLVLGPDDLSNNQRGAHYIRVVGRLKAGITPDQGQADLDRIERRLAEQYPDKIGEYSVRVEPLLDMFVGDVRRPLLVLFGAVMFVLLIACVNVSNLLLARATTRTGEIAVRSALGAGRRRIVAQLLAESLVLAAAGGVAGLVLTVWAVRALSTLAPQDLPRGVAFSLNPAVLTFAVAVSLLTGIVFGLVPAVVASRTDVASLLKDLRRGTGSAGRGRAIRNVLVSAEVALSLILLAGAGLAMRSFDRLMHVEPGFDPSHVLTFTIRLPEARYSTFASAETFFRELNGRLHRPGVVSSGAIFQPPLSPDGFGGSFTIVGRPAGQDEGNAQVRPVTTGYLETLRIPLLAGRRVDSGDRGGAPGVAVISQTAARRYWPDQNPIGRQLRIHVSMGVKEQVREIVGVVGDVRSRALDQPFVPIIYVPASQYVSDAMTFVVRTEGDPLNAVPDRHHRACRSGSTGRDEPRADDGGCRGGFGGGAAVPHEDPRAVRRGGAAARRCRPLRRRGVLGHAAKCGAGASDGAWRASAGRPEAGAASGTGAGRSGNRLRPRGSCRADERHADTALRGQRARSAHLRRCVHRVADRGDRGVLRPGPARHGTRSGQHAALSSALTRPRAA